MNISIFLSIGLFAGVLAGLFGVGGGVVIVPALAIGVGFSQIAATGTSLVALLAPVGLGGVYAYYHAGKIDMMNIKAGLLISVGMFLGSYLGSRVGLYLPEIILKRSFCIFLVAIATKMWMATLS
jgi:uncharacterized membrane protein YfcA